MELVIDASYHLSIQVKLDGFSFAILNIEEQKYVGIEYYDIKNCNSYSTLADHIDKIILNQELLKQNFTSCSVAISNHINTLTPKELYDHNNVKEILAFNHVILENEKETRDWLPSIQAYNSKDDILKLLEASKIIY